ncbi:MAG: protein BatD [Chlorobiaceae bacterium]|nr:protein BatD [Chlorobiaceae bacterium]
MNDMVTGFARYLLFCTLIIAALCTPVSAEASEIRESRPFLASSINNTNPFVGQEVLLTYRLFFKDAAPTISKEVSPSFQGVWAKETKPERFIKSINTTVKGEQFRSAVVKQFRLVPIQNGKITISGYSMLCTRPNTAADGKQLSEIPARITAPVITISARALPEPVPENLSGAVGIFSLNLFADKQNLRIGEPLTVKLTLSGTGSLLTLELPDIPLPESFRHDLPEKKITLNKESETTSGTISATIIAWPQSEGDFQIPSIPLVVFNPETQQFSTLHSKPISITVASAAQGASEHSEEPPNTSTEEKSMINQLYSAIALLLLMTGAAVVLVRKKRLDDAKKMVAKNTTAHPPESRKAARTMKEQLFVLLEEAGVQRPGGMTRRELINALQVIKITDETRLELPEVLDTLDGILYSPAGEKENQMPDGISEKVNSLLHALKKAASSR